MEDKSMRFIGGADEEFPPLMISINDEKYEVIGTSKRTNMIPKNLTGDISRAAIENNIGQFLIVDSAIKVYEIFMYELEGKLYAGPMVLVK